MKKKLYERLKKSFPFSYLIKIKRRPPSLSDLIPYKITLGLTDLGSEASKYHKSSAEFSTMAISKDNKANQIDLKIITLGNH